MAKTCAVCNQSYPDDQAACPHCAARKRETVNLAGPSSDVPGKPAAAPHPGMPSDSAVDLGQPVPAPGSSEQPLDLSGVSAIEWAALVEEPTPKVEPSSAHFDSPSDVELLAKGDTQPPAPAPEAPKSPLLASAGSLPPPPGASKQTMLSAAGGPAQPEGGKQTMLAPPGVVPGDQGPKATMLAPGGTLPDEGGKQTMLAPGGSLPEEGGPKQTMLAAGDVVLPTGDPKATMLAGPAGGPAPGDSGVNLEEAGKAPAEAPGLPSPSGSSRVDLTADVPSSEVVSESGIDLVELESREPGAAPPALSDTTGPGVDLGEAARATPETPAAGPPAAAESGIDLVTLESSERPREAVTPPPGPKPPSGEIPVTRRGVTETRIELTPSGPAARDIAGEVESASALFSGSDIASGSDISSGSESQSGSSVESGSALEPEVEIGKAPAVHAGDTPPSSAINLGDMNFPLEDKSAASKVSAAAESGIDLEVIGGAAPGSKPKLVPDAGPDSGIDVEVIGGSGRRKIGDSMVDLGSSPEVRAGDSGIAVAEGEVAEEAEEAEEAEAEEEEERPRRRGREEKAERKRGGGLLIGSAVGLLIGAGAALGLWVFGVEPPASWRMGGKPPSAEGSRVGPRPGMPAAPTPEQRAEYLRNGDFEKAARAGIETAAETDPAALVLRGEYRWLTYLDKQARAGAPAFKATDEAVKQALADLQKGIEEMAKAPDMKTSPVMADALYIQGQIEQYTGDVKKAKVTYAKAADLFKAVPDQKQRFETALLRLEDTTPAGAARAEPMRLLLETLIALQAPPMPPAVPPAGAPPAAPAELPEAGFDFEQALREARRQDYSKALTLLQKARDEHNRRRFTRLRKQQNPLSDPLEEIFLRSADEIAKYWQIDNKLKDAKFLAADKRDPVKAVDTLLDEVKTGGPVVKALADKLVKADVIAKPDDWAKGVDQLLTDRKAATTKIADLEKAAKADGMKITKLEGDLKTTAATLKTTSTKLKEATAKVTGLEAEKTKTDATLKEAAGVLVEADFLKEGMAKTGFLAGLKNAVAMAKLKDPDKLIRKLKTDVAKDEAALKERWRPEEMLTFWTPLLQQDRTRKDLAAKATVDVGRVLGDPAATPVQKGRAELVRGLALRNEEKFAEAKKALATAARSLTGADLAAATAALREVTDPAAYFLRRAEALRDEGKPAEARELLSRGIGAVVDGNAVLMAQRSLLELDDARGRFNGPLPATDVMVKAARADADAAAKAGLAEGHFAAGRVAEEMGKWDDAIKNYRAAVAAHPARDTDGNRYRIALARVLVQPREAAPAKPADKPKPPDTKLGRRLGRLPAADASGPRAARRSLLVLLTLAFQAPGMAGEPSPAAAEAERLADEVLKSPPGTVPFDVRAQALAVKGLYTEALRVYLGGLRPLMRQPRYADELMRLVNSHPLLSLPESLSVPSPLEAEKHYAAGLNFYFDRNYADAEKEFKATIRNDREDARYWYFLGLSQLAQGVRGSGAAFEQGALLEQRDRPSPAAVSTALERVQGPMRRTLNEARNRPR